MTPTTQSRKRGRRALAWGLRLGITATALGWTFTQITLDDLIRAFLRLDTTAAGVGLALSFFNLGLGAVRWRLLLSAYGARDAPRLPRLFHLYLVGLFYNTFLPANVGGDVLRGFVTRRAFDGQAGAYLIVIIERVFGLAGLLLLAGSVLLVHPIEGLTRLAWLAYVGLAAAALASAAPLLGRALGRFVPGPLGRLLSSLPAVRQKLLLVPVLLLSLGTHSVIALTGHILMDAIDPHVTLGMSLVLVPVALAAIYFPTVAGLGAREAAFIVLFGTVGVTKADATAASLAFFALQLLVAVAGGVASLFPLPVMVDSPPNAAQEPRNGTL